MFKISIPEILLTIGKSKHVSIDVPINYSDADCTFKQPVHAELLITNVQEEVLVTGMAKAIVEMPCNRCAIPFELEIMAEVEEEFKTEEQLFQFDASDHKIGREDLQFTIDAKGNIDIEESLRAVILSNLPLNPICSSCPEAVTYTAK